MSRASDVVASLAGKTLAVAESLTGGSIGQAVTAVPGSSAVFRGGVISYTDEVKHRLLGVKEETLSQEGAVSEAVAKQMADGARHLLGADVAVSATGLAGPGGDDRGNPVGLVFIGYADEKRVLARRFLFTGDREQVRSQTVQEALRLILEMQ